MRQSENEEELQQIEAEVTPNPMDWELPDVIKYFEKQGGKQVGLEVCRENNATGKWIESLFNYPKTDVILEDEFLVEGDLARAKLIYKVK